MFQQDEGILGSENTDPDPELKKAYQKFRLNGLPVKSPLDYLQDLIECTKADCCDGHVELCTGNECGDKPHHSHHGPCCKTEATPSEPPIVEGDLVEGASQNNGDLKNVHPPPPDFIPLCQNVSRETLPYPDNTLRITGNSGGWLWVMGIQGRPSESNTAMNTALSSLKSEIFLQKFWRFRTKNFNVYSFQILWKVEE